MNKATNQHGKAYQRSDREDRSLPFRDWLRGVNTGKQGYFMDLDLVKFRKTEEGWRPVALIDVTRCDHEEAGQGYLDSIEGRLFERDSQGEILTDTAKALGIPAYFVVFQKDMGWFWVLSLPSRQWKKYTEPEWAERIDSL